MDINQLRAFDQIVRYGSFSKAARMLDISQPTISLRVQALEQAIGTSLFTRGGNRLELTEAGKCFLPYVRRILTTLSAGVEEIKLIERGMRGRVMIGTLPSLTTGFFASTLSHLYSTHPSIDIVVHTGHSQQIVEMLYDGFVHLGLITWPFFSTGLTTLLRIQEPLIVVTHAEHPLAHQAAVSLAELKQTANPFLHIDWNTDARNWLLQETTTEGVVVEIPPQTARELLLRGVGAALQTRALVNEDLKAGRLTEISVKNAQPPMRESALVCLNRDEDFPVAVNEFIRIFQEKARKYCRV